MKFLSVAQKGVIAFGTFWVVWGLVVLGSGLKDKTAPDIKQGIGQMCGGAVIILAGAMISNIHFLKYNSGQLSGISFMKKERS